MHGLGDTANGWTDFIMSSHFIMMLRKRQGVFTNTKFILPTAPTRRVTLVRRRLFHEHYYNTSIADNTFFNLQTGGMTSAWADIFGLSVLDQEDEAGYDKSVSRITKIMDGENNIGINSNRIVVGGFSQGGATAYLSALAYPKTLGDELNDRCYIY